MKVKKIRIGGLKKEEWFAMQKTLKEMIESYGADILGVLSYFPSFLIMYQWSDELLEKLKKEFVHEAVERCG